MTTFRTLSFLPLIFCFVFSQTIEAKCKSNQSTKADYVATAFLNEKVVNSKGQGVKGRKLRIFFKSTALRTIWKGNKAVGVEYLQDGITKKVFAKKGIIVSAGLKSSFFLLHSGIGPKSLLDSLGIPVIFDNPNVGQGLVDHPGVPTLFTANPLDVDIFAIPRIFASISFLPAPGRDPGVRALRFSAANAQTPGLFAGILDLLQPLSRGSLTINSSDPLAPPVIDLGFLTNPSDLTLLRQGLQMYVRNIANALTTHDPLYNLILPDPSILNDDNLVDDYIKEVLFSNQSFQSHCRMAPQNQGGVVDSFGRVYGAKNLYVADNSIVPQCMDGAPMASGYLIGANIARLIIENQK
jgi:choline dehydrogenase-like flavoprotein